MDRNALLKRNLTSTTGDRPNWLQRLISGIGNSGTKLGNWFGSIFDNVGAKYFGTGLTDAEKEQNAYTAMREDTQAQRAVLDYQAAGINPALMYQSGAGGDYASPSAGSVAGTGSLGDLMSAFTLPLQIEQMKANIQATKENTNSERLRQQKLVQETQNLKHLANEILSRTDLNDAQREQILTVSMYLDRQLDADLRLREEDIKLKRSTRIRIDALLDGEKLLQSRQAEDYLRGRV